MKKPEEPLKLVSSKPDNEHDGEGVGENVHYGTSRGIGDVKPTTTNPVTMTEYDAPQEKTPGVDTD